MTGQELGQQQAHPIPGFDGPDKSMKAIAGMTKREAFAMACLQGAMAGADVDSMSPEGCAEMACKLADALLAELAMEG